MLYNDKNFEFSEWSLVLVEYQNIIFENKNGPT